VLSLKYVSDLHILWIHKESLYKSNYNNYTPII